MGEVLNFGADQIPRPLILQAGRNRSREEIDRSLYRGSVQRPDILDMCDVTSVVDKAAYRIARILARLLPGPLVSK